jgi:two-component system, OmpR family, response regulator
MKILVIDDDQDVANLLVQHLEQSGHTIRCANNGRDGLDLAVTESVDLIILDRQLPENIDGIFLLKILRSDNNQTPILILSGQSSAFDHVEGFHAGTDDYLGKPFTLKELDRRIEFITKGRYTGGHLAEAR